jgi:diacylglycerol kinase family enzyme
MDHTTSTEEIIEVLVANGQFFGSGMKIAPRALPDDGRFNVQTWRGGPRDVLELLPAARVGEHLSAPVTREWQSATVEVNAVQPLAVSADGELLGTTPASFEVLERVLRLSV